MTPIPKPARRGPKPRKRIKVRRPAGTVRREAKAAGSVDPDTWNAVLAFYSFRCAYCGTGKAEQQDHIRPLSRGGKHCISNVVPSCTRCNALKGTSTKWTPYLKHPWMERP